MQGWRLWRGVVLGAGLGLVAGCQTTGAPSPQATALAGPVVHTGQPIAFRFDGSETTGSLTVTEANAIYCDDYLEETGQERCHTLGYDLEGSTLVLDNFRYAWRDGSESNTNLTAKISIDGYTGSCFGRLNFVWAGYIRGRNRFPASATGC